MRITAIISGLPRKVMVLAISVKMVKSEDTYQGRMWILLFIAPCYRMGMVISG
jgi:hypothetical protein